MTWDNPGYGTHLEALVWAMSRTRGPVLEIGAGEWSTPFLHQVCHGCGLVTVETNPEWMARFAHLANDYHIFEPAMTAALEERRWGVVLVDGDPEDTRGQWLDKLNTDFFVVHDSQVEGDGTFRENREAIRRKLLTAPHWKEFCAQMPHTMVIWR